MIGQPGQRRHAVSTRRSQRSSAASSRGWRAAHGSAKVRRNERADAPRRAAATKCGANARRTVADRRVADRQPAPGRAAAPQPPQRLARLPARQVPDPFPRHHRPHHAQQRPRRRAAAAASAACDAGQIGHAVQAAEVRERAVEGPRRQLRPGPRSPSRSDVDQARSARRCATLARAIGEHRGRDVGGEHAHAALARGGPRPRRCRSSARSTRSPGRKAASSRRHTAARIALPDRARR